MVSECILVCEHVPANKGVLVCKAVCVSGSTKCHCVRVCSGALVNEKVLCARLCEFVKMRVM